MTDSDLVDFSAIFFYGTLACLCFLFDDLMTLWNFFCIFYGILVWLCFLVDDLMKFVCIFNGILVGLRFLVDDLDAGCSGRSKRR